MSTTATISSNDEGIVPEGILNPSSQHLSTDAEVINIFNKMQENYISFTKSSPQRNSNLEDDREISQLLRNEVANLLTEGQPSHHQDNTDTKSTDTHGSQEQLHAASLVRLLSNQLDKFDQLLQKNEAAQETILQLQQGSDWLKETCLSLQRSEAKKTKKISLLERKIGDLEKLVIDMKLNEAESRSREDHYKLEIANLEHRLVKGIEPSRQRKGGLKHAQSLILPSGSKVSKGEHTEINPLLTRSFSSFFRKPDISDRSGGESGSETPKVAVSKPSLGTDKSDRRSSETKKKVPRKEDEKIATTVPKPEPSGWYNPKRSIRNSAPNDCSHPTAVPSRRATHLSNITDLTDEAWEDTQMDEADRSFGSDSSPCELSPHPVFEAADEQLKLKLSFRGRLTHAKNEVDKNEEDKKEEDKNEEDRQGEAIPKNFLSYC